MHEHNQRNAETGAFDLDARSMGGQAPSEPAPITGDSADHPIDCEAMTIIESTSQNHVSYLGWGVATVTGVSLWVLGLRLFGVI